MPVRAMSLKTRAIESKDLPRIRTLYEKHYPELDIPDYMNMLVGYVIEDKDDIVIAGGVKMVPEAQIVTNKDMSRIKIGKALVEAQTVSVYACSLHNLTELIAHTDNDQYIKHLIKHGFRDHGRALRMDIPNG